MKRIVIAFSIIIVSAGVGIFSFVFVKNTCNETVAAVEKVVESAVTENREEVNRLTAQMNLNWQNKIFWMNILIGREYTCQVDKLLNKMTYSAEKSDYQSVISGGEECKAELLYIIESNEPKLGTVL